MDASRSKPSSSSSHSPSPAPVTGSERKTRDSGLCQTSDIPEIPSFCIDNLNSIRLGRGTYGVVEKTRYRKSRNHEFGPAAIKYANDSPSNIIVLIREAKVMMSLRDHPNVIKIYGLYHCPRNGRGVVMEHMDCGSMADLIYLRKSINYTIDHFATWMRQLSSAVDFFHVNDQVHRDLKLQNMLLCDRYRTMKLCDFGTFTSMHQSMTSNRGTPITMAPEIFRCEPYNTKSDIYSIGIIMWQVLARSHPYNQNLSVPGLLYNVATTNLRPPELQCNPILSSFYKKCWHNDPEERPTSSQCVEYFECLENEYPNGTEPLSDSTTNGPAHTPQPRALRPSPPFGTASGSGSHGRTPTPSNRLHAPTPERKTHRRTGSDQTTIGLNVPSSASVSSASVQPAVKGTRSKSVASDLHNAAANGHRSPHRDAPPPPGVRRKSSDENRMAFLSIMGDHELRPIEPDESDLTSLQIYNEHCQECEALVDVIDLKKEIMIKKHEALSLWSKHEKHAELLERMHYLEQMIGRIERNSASTDDEIAFHTERM
ncbi:unnamed protein product [Caenorhabditis sp. 36 PRJEB53466]|nr:unnamed protein product [Caenorhabditis sp. 36 PRJEB53466]